MQLVFATYWTDFSRVVSICDCSPLTIKVVMGNETELRMRWIQVSISNYVCIKMIRKNQFGRNFNAMVIIVNEILPHDFRND